MTTNNIAIIVDFDAVEGKADELVALLTDHGQRTLQEEKGCLRFEVIRPFGDDGLPLDDRVAVNELYRGQTALEAHRTNPRSPAFGAALGALTTARRVVKAYVAAAGQSTETEQGQP